MADDPLRRRLRVWLSAYFEALRHERNYSLNTVRSYKDTWRLLFAFGRERKNMADPRDWRLAQLERSFVLDFLTYLETERRCSIATRNQRLAAIQSFFAWLRGMEPSLRDTCERVLSICSKRCPRPVVSYLESDELRVVLDAVDLSRAEGVRDFALLCFAYNTGARVHEIAALRKTWLSLHAHPSVSIWGKGNKQRQLPLWDACARMLRLYLQKHRRPAGVAADDSFVFIGQRGGRMTRFGVARILEQAFVRAAVHCPSLRYKHLTAHSMRHTTAVHLLQNGADLISIQNWLGHESLDTVQIYLSLDLQRKREILDRCLSSDYVARRLGGGSVPQCDTQETDDGDWLEGL